MNRQAGIPLTIWYNRQEPVNPWHSFGLIDVRDRPKPAYIALAPDVGPASRDKSRVRP